MTGMILIPAGEAYIGSDRGYPEERPVHTVTIGAFYMDSSPVTNAEYLKFCDSTGTTHPDDPRWPDAPNYFSDYPEHPVVNVSSEQALACARWSGKRLPTEAEWEYAAAGGLTGAEYPWGCQATDGSKANYADRNTDFPWREFLHSSGWRYTSPVGSFTANGYGLYDMAGNVWQWCEDWFFAYTDTERSLEFLEDGWGGAKVCRGGCYHSSPFDLRIARRRQVLGGAAQISVGFRCVVDVDADHDRDIKKGGVRVALPANSDWTEKLVTTSVVVADGLELCLGVGKLTRERAHAIRNLGFTSVEQYVPWESIENEERDRWDFSDWDEQVAILLEVGLKWVPFLIAGPAYSLPDWYRESRDFEGLCCLEHNIESKIQSIWDTHFYYYIKRFLEAFADHFRDTDVLEAPLLGISGDFGESIFPVWHGNWPTQIAGLYHSHAGYWCGDRFARRDFRKKIREKYQTVDRLNACWESNWKDFDAVAMPELQVDPVAGFRVDEFTNAGVPSLDTIGERRRWLDFVEWYRRSMTEYSRFWMSTARRCFPDAPIYLCTGGDAASYQGAEFAQQCKMAAKHSGGIRITNEASDYATNFTVTNWVASAGNFYGAYSSFEPAGMVNEKGVVCRIYNATAAGAEGLHYYENNLFGSEERADLLLKTLPSFRRRALQKPIGVFYPDTSLVLGTVTAPELLKGYELFRDYSDFLFLDDLTVADGILETIRVAVFCCGEAYRSDTLLTVLRWVEAGGILVGYNIKNLHAVENDEAFLSRLFEPSGGGKSPGKGFTFHLPIRVNIVPPEVEWIVGTHPTDIAVVEDIAHYQRHLFDPITAFLESHGVSIPDGVLDRVYVTETKDGLVWLNTNMEIVEREGISLPANSIVESRHHR